MQLKYNIGNACSNTRIDHVGHLHKYNSLLYFMKVAKCTAAKVGFTEPDTTYIHSLFITISFGQWSEVPQLTLHFLLIYRFYFID